MKLPMLAMDKANHYIYGTWLGVFGGTIVLAIAANINHSFTDAQTLIAAASAAIITALTGGKIKELMDARSNEKAIDEGYLPEHEVSNADMLATMFGAYPVAIILCIVAIFA